MKRPSRKELREALETVPVDQILGVPGELTKRQKTFARLVASGEKGAVAYRKAYNTTSTRAKTIGNAASDLKKHPGIAREIEAFKLANEAMEYQTPQQLRALVIHSLVQVVTDPDAKHATKVQAAKVLGTVTEVAAFTERREVRTIKSSDDAKAQLLAKLRAVMATDAIDVQSRDVDSLLAEILPSDPPAVLETDEAQELTPTPQDGVRSPTLSIHTIPHTESVDNSDTPSPSQNPPDDLELELGNTPR